MVNSFNIFQTIGVPLYENRLWTVIGILFFLFIVYCIITYRDKRHSPILVLNFALVLLGVSFYGLANILGDEGYRKIITFVPFITNGPFFALFVLYIPLIILMGLLLKTG